jgi:hypothetical protein
VRIVQLLRGENNPKDFNQDFVCISSVCNLGRDTQKVEAKSNNKKIFEWYFFASHINPYNKQQ